MTTNTPRSLLKGWTTEITIAAPQAIIWNHLIDFASYSDWNPFMLEAQATFKVGGKIRFLETLQEFGQHWITAKFLTIAAPHEFAWQGYIYAPFLFNVRHSFQLEAITPAQTHLIHSHQHTGLLVPYLCDRGVFQRSHEGYLAFNEALKKRCEPKNH